MKSHCVVFYGWRKGLLVVSFVRALRRYALGGLGESKKVADKIVSTPPLSVEFESTDAAVKAASHLESVDIPCVRYKSTVNVYGCGPELESEFASIVTSLHGAVSCPSQVLIEGWLNARREIVMCPSKESALSLSNEANAIGVIARAVEQERLG